jgi:uncharacterized protein (UPF0548 family)
MLSLRKPSLRAIQQFVERQSKMDFSYTAVGATANVAPAGYVVDHTRIKLGESEATFVAAKAALLCWEHFQLGWVEGPLPETPIKQGAVLAILARVGGFWWANACRIVYVLDEPGPTCKFGFAYGTLPGNAGSGEKRFLVEWDRKSGEVSYDILAIYRPQHVLARLRFPGLRRAKERFGQESAAAMLAGVRLRTT